MRLTKSKKMSAAYAVAAVLAFAPMYNDANAAGVNSLNAFLPDGYRYEWEDNRGTGSGLQCGFNHTLLLGTSYYYKNDDSKNDNNARACSGIPASRIGQDFRVAVAPPAPTRTATSPTVTSRTVTRGGSTHEPPTPTRTVTSGGSTYEPPTPVMSEVDALLFQFDGPACWAFDYNSGENVLGVLKRYTYGASMTVTSENTEYSLCFDWSASVELLGGCAPYADQSAGELIAPYGLEFRSVCVAPIGTPETPEGELRLSVTE